MTEKLISDALTAFADRDITPPSTDDLRIALIAFETSLTRCGCEACTTARRDRVALSEHDRTSLARVLHEIVYSPGANYDRAVPGIQEHMLACAEKVAAALPWLAPHTPTDDEREAVTGAVERLRGYVEAGSVIHTASSYRTSDGRVHLIEFNDLRTVLDAATATTGDEAVALVDAVMGAMDRWSVNANLDGDDEPGLWVPRVRIEAAIDSVPLPFAAESQGEPPDAEVREIIREALRQRGEGAVYSDTLAGYLSRALRTAAVTEQGENR